MGKSGKSRGWLLGDKYRFRFEKMGYVFTSYYTIISANWIVLRVAAKLFSSILTAHANSINEYAERNCDNTQNCAIGAIVEIKREISSTSHLFIKSIIITKFTSFYCFRFSARMVVKMSRLLVRFLCGRCKP